MSKPARILGVDFGLARIGIALSDERKIIASPIGVVKAEKRSEETVKRFLIEIERLEKEHLCIIEEIVVGLPLMMNGRIGMLADEVQHFVNLLKENTEVPIILWDERLTSVQAERSLRESKMSRKKRSQKIDTVAAAIILQNYLDSLF